MELINKTAVITGVSKGIGYYTAKALLDEGVIVYGWGRTAPDFTHPNFRFMEVDIRQWPAVQEAAARVLAENQGKVEILINNAGLGYFAYLEETSIEQWHEMLDTNLSGLFYCIKAFLPDMKKNELGHIINIASTAATEGYLQVGAYGATKWAVRGLSESLYKEARDFNVKVTCVYPGSVKTDFFRNTPSITPHDNMMMPWDVAGNIVFMLKSPENFHHINIEFRPTRPKGPRKPEAGK